MRHTILAGFVLTATAVAFLFGYFRLPQRVLAQSADTQAKVAAQNAEIAKLEAEIAKFKEHLRLRRL